MKQLLIAVLLLCVLLFSGACGMGGKRAGSYDGQYAAAGRSSAAPGRGYDSVPEEAALDWERPGNSAEAPALVSEGGVVQGSAVQTRKLVKTAELRLRAEDPEATERPLSALMEKYGAWSASTGIYDNSRSYSIRVPSSSYDSMLGELAGLGKMLRRTENAEDVTLHYYDLESRLGTKRELLKTYQGYLAKAANIDEIMTVESRIADLQREIDQTGTQFRNLANLVDYSTINLEISGPVGASGYSEPSLGEKLGELFSSFGDVASSVLVVLTGIIIYGIPGILILILLFWILFGRIGLLKKLWRLVAGKK